jgi:hypothetical protein
MPPPSRNIKAFPRTYNRLIVVPLRKKQRKTLRILHGDIALLCSIKPDFHFRSIRFVDAVLVLSAGIKAFCG